MLKLHHHPFSTFSRRVRIALLEKNIPCELVEVDMMARAHRSAGVPGAQPVRPRADAGGRRLRALRVDGDPRVPRSDASDPAAGARRCARPRSGVDAHEALRHPDGAADGHHHLPQDASCPRTAGTRRRWRRPRRRSRSTSRSSSRSSPARSTWWAIATRSSRCATRRSSSSSPLMEITPPPAVAAWVQRMLERPSAQQTKPAA